ncbi:MAG: Ig-like domain-containing protein, partial [Acidimicrobiales bacterium]
MTFTSTALAAAPASLVKAAGDAQTAGASQPLPVPLGVLVRDAHGNPTPGRPVAWARVAGSGTLAASQTATDATGIARVGYTLGTAGTDTVSAALVGSVLPPVRFTATAAAQPTLVAQVPIPASYGIHDTFVRDGLAFVSAWNTGIMIFDVGNGIRGGSPASPQLVSTTPTAGGQAHNAWWFHNPNTSEKKYLFVGQEGPGAIGSSSSGDIHVLDVTSLVNPVEVATYHLNGAGTHNFWIDEQAQILYAAYYNAGVVALDVSGTLPANLASRELWRLPPGGAGNTYTWGVQLYNGSVYAIDMLSGLWQLRATAPAGVLAGGNNVPERYGSDLWVHGGYAYTGTWGFRSASGNAVKIWQLDAGGAPTLVDSIVQPGVST